MSDNELTGIVPPSIRALSSLKSLVLEGNELNGSLPTQGSIPEAFLNISEIVTLDISDNKLSGIIPSAIVHVGTLTYRDESVHDSERFERQSKYIEVNFVTKYGLRSYKGSILRYMSGLDFSCNNLTGAIPLELGQLQGIHALNLSHNQFTGSIPKTFSNLTELESLDLSHHRLSGEIPPQLIKLTFLEVFSVAYNNLSGRTPDMKAQFGTFSASSYEGNPLLCVVLPLEKNCTNRYDSPPTPTQSLDASDEKWPKMKMDQTVSGIGNSVADCSMSISEVEVLGLDLGLRERSQAITYERIGWQFVTFVL
nr:phytosulfokine receptor 1 [Quercus suber]